MSQYLSEAEANAIAVKHVHQCLEGMVSGAAAERNCTEELASRFVQNWTRAIVRELMDANEPHPSH